MSDSGVGDLIAAPEIQGLQPRTGSPDMSDSSVGDLIAALETQGLQPRAAIRDKTESGVGDLIAVSEIEGLYTPSCCWEKRRGHVAFTGTKRHFVHENPPALQPQHHTATFLRSFAAMLVIPGCSERSKLKNKLRVLRWHIALSR